MCLLQMLQTSKFSKTVDKKKVITGFYFSGSPCKGSGFMLCITCTSDRL